ncbi:LamG-like jellyroll fold domain-containing protein [Posidoniimonas polymericola]|uniref:LamG-like jellyroll fold domain-containing protein n=1 Tax=Posidoniimonas polymericola TaxID=2528002 RepID=UPI0018D4322D|nr:LamG-like jellyroll fold domain-containing protein [Posidoniimonas polymericola]
MAQSLVHRWSFENDYSDASGNGNTGTPVGSPTFVPGKFGQAVALAATPDEGVTPGDGVANDFADGLPTLGDESWSLNVWTDSAGGFLTHVAGFGVNWQYAGGIDDGRARAIIDFNGFHFWGANVDLNSGVTYPTDGNFHMYTVTYEGASSVVSMYVDGAAVQSNEVAPLVDTFPYIQVGNRSFWSEGFDGAVDEFSVFSGTLSEQQIGGLYFFNDHTQSVTIDPTFTVDRDSGEIVFTNDSSFDIDLLGYTVRSASGALNPSMWDSVAGRFDGAGDESIDDDTWTVLTNSAKEYSIEFSEGAPGTDGGTISMGKTVSFGADTWIANPGEDVFIDLLLNDGQGTIKTIAATFTGNAGESYAPGDFDADGDIDATDYALFRSGADADTSGFLAVQTYLGGDLNGDGRKNLTDYGIFRSLYDNANGAGSFIAMASGVPEPTTLALLIPLGALASSLVRRRACLLAVLCLGMAVAGDAHAQFHAYYPLNGNADELSGSNIDLQLVGGATFEGSLHPGLGNAFSGDGVDDAAVGQNFVRVSGNSMSAVAWVFAKSNTGDWESIVKNWGSTIQGQFHFGLGLADANTLNSQYATSDPVEFVSDVTPEDLPVGQWVHTAFVLDADAGEHRLYVNGAVVATSPYAGSLLQPGDAGWATGLGIGAKPNDDGSAATGGFGFWDGYIDEVGLYSRALSSAEISQIVSNAQQGIQLDGTTNPYVEIEVNRSSGLVTLKNNTAGAVNLKGYEIESLGGNLDATELDPLAGNAGFPVGSGTGNGWESDGANGPTQIIESYFDGASTFAAGTTPLGFIYKGASAADEDIRLRFSTPGGIVSSFVTYVDNYQSLLGDFNGDGMVNAADYTVWRDNLNAPTEDLINNSGDGINGVDAQDYVVWKNNFGAQASGVSAAVPEPSALVLGMLILTSMAGRSPTRQ